MKIEVEVRVKIVETGDKRVVHYSQAETIDVSDNPRFAQHDARKAIDHVEELVLTAVAVQYPPFA